MVITFLVLTSPNPIGGALALYEFANGMKRRGHSVNVVHMGLTEPIAGLGDLPWASFEDGIDHRFLPAHRPILRITSEDGNQHVFPGDRSAADCLPEADFIAVYDEQLSPRHGLPFLFVQGYQTLFPAVEEAVFQVPCPKVCIARWLVEVGIQKGVPADELPFVPYGLKHDKYRLVSPIEERAPLVSMAYHSHPQKASAEGLAALSEVKRRVPEAEALVFSRLAPAHDTATWMTVVVNPPQQQIVNEIYNRSRIFLCASRVEGFGLPSIEAMACGAALVTTSNGGSDDYAFHGETALVCEPDDVMGMADHVERLLRDDALRIRLAKQGMEYVRRTYDWDASAEQLETFLDAYAAGR
jgi:glycosyltransferase involved in cell wall biosynthesis